MYAVCYELLVSMRGDARRKNARQIARDTPHTRHAERSAARRQEEERPPTATVQYATWRRGGKSTPRVYTETASYVFKLHPIPFYWSATDTTVR